MICAPTRSPVADGAHAIEFCLEHFAPIAGTRLPHRPAFVLHVVGLSASDNSAAFALVPVEDSTRAQWFTARWGRTGVGSTNFMPVPEQIEDGRSAAITVYGHRSYAFTWRNAQWEIQDLVPPGSLDIGSLDGDTVERASNVQGVWAFRDGVALANLDELEAGVHPKLGVTKEAESNDSYTIRFGGRIWRCRPEAESLELIAFDPQSEVLQDALGEVWAEIGGQEEAKRELIRAIQWPVLYPELFRLFKRRRSRGVLLYGPPGCGKTLLGKAVVRLMAALYHRRADDGGFKYVKGHQLLDQFVGNSEKAVKGLFDDARRWREQKGYPAVLFFDEADSLFKRRPSSGEGGFTLVPALLAEMDGMDESGAFVMLATNRPDALDVAITRPGRIDRRIRITRPDQEASRTIFRIHLEGVFLAGDLTLDELCAHAAEALFAETHVLYQISFDAGETIFRLRDLASGALIQNIVDRATANKMESCIESGVTVGMECADIDRAIDEVLGEQRASRHDEELAMFAESRGREIVSARRLERAFVDGRILGTTWKEPSIG